MTHVLRISQYTEDAQAKDGAAPVVRTIAAEALMFIYDDCHKIYLITSAAGLKQMLDHGWDRSDLRHPSELPEVWKDTCGLRFINDADLEQDYESWSYVPQCAEEWGPVTVTWEPVEPIALN